MSGSASKDLMRQGSETLAGRIRYLELTPFLLSEVVARGAPEPHWLKGSFPSSWLAADEGASFDWRLHPGYVS